MTWREYHESTKHSVESLRRTPHVLDWANMPDPFRHYEGVPVLDLPADPPVPEIPALDVLQGISGATSAGDGADVPFATAVLFRRDQRVQTRSVHRISVRVASESILRESAPNRIPLSHTGPEGVARWAVSLPIPQRTWPNSARCGDLEMKLAGGSAPIVFVLTSIAWREAWKYRDRAYRYCLHDIGHAWQALALAARAIGCDSFAVGHFPDDEVAQFCRLHEDEWPMLIVELRGESIPVREARRRRDRLVRRARESAFEGNDRLPAD